jgi:hypothetical protein
VKQSTMTMSVHEGHRITYGQMIRDRRVLMDLISACVAMILMFFFDSILSDHLIYDVGVSDKDIGKNSLGITYLNIRVLLWRDMLILCLISSCSHMALQKS